MRTVAPGVIGLSLERRKPRRASSPERPKPPLDGDEFPAGERP
jgi:hypothetical protein